MFSFCYSQNFYKKLSEVTLVFSDRRCLQAHKHHGNPTQTHGHLVNKKSDKYQFTI